MAAFHPLLLLCFVTAVSMFATICCLTPVLVSAQVKEAVVAPVSAATACRCNTSIPLYNATFVNEGLINANAAGTDGVTDQNCGATRLPYASSGLYATLNCQLQCWCLVHKFSSTLAQYTLFQLVSGNITYQGSSRAEIYPSQNDPCIMEPYAYLMQQQDGTHTSCWQYQSVYNVTLSAGGAGM